MKTLLFLAATLIPWQQFRAPYNISPVTFVSFATDQAGGTKYCENTSTDGLLYTCNLGSEALKVYTKGMVITFLPDIPAPMGATLNIDTVGPVTITDPTGTPTPVPATPHLLFYDGNVFRMMI